MKKFNFINFLLFLSLTLTQTMQNYENKLFSGSIEFPYHTDYDLCIFYKGQKLDFETNNNAPFVQFSFLDHKNVTTVYLVITNALTCTTSESNNVNCLRVIDDNAYVCYKLQAQRNFEKDQEELSWNICQYTLPHNQIPHNSVIFLFDPTLIAGLKVQTFKPENVFRIIPTIMIDPHANIDQIKRAMIIARLASLDIDAIHAKPEKISTTTALLTAMP